MQDFGRLGNVFYLKRTRFAPVGKDRFSGYVVYDDAAKAKRPGLVMVPNWMGVTDDAVARAKAIAGDD